MAGYDKKQISTTIQKRSVVFLWLVLLLALWPVVGSRASERSELHAAARRGLATIDSLLQTSSPQQALPVAQRFWRTMGSDPAYGWQFESRLGLALLLAGQAEAAVPHLEEAVLRQPFEADFHRNLGAALVQLNRRGRALSEYQVAVELEPGNAALHREFGQMLLGFRDTRRAARELHLAWELCGGCREMVEPLASLYLQQKKFKLAVPLLRQLRARDPGADADRRLMGALLNSGQDSSLVEFVASVPPVVRTSEQWRLLIEAEGRLGKPHHSELLMAELNAGVGQVPLVIATNDVLWGQVALNLLAAGQYEGGLQAIVQALQLAPKSVIYLNNKVVLLTRLGRDAEARVVWEKVIALDPSLARD